MRYQLWEIFFRNPRSLDEKLDNIKVTFTNLFLIMLWIIVAALGLASGVAVLAVLGLLLIAYSAVRFVYGAYVMTNV